jgi:hypothetical protein
MSVDSRLTWYALDVEDPGPSGERLSAYSKEAW